MTDDEIVRTTIILRRWRSDQWAGVIALFPELPADTAGYEVTSYEHVGQHGPADYAHVMGLTRPVAETDPDAADLVAELRRIGYDPIIRQRRTYAMLKRYLRAVIAHADPEREVPA